MYELHKTWYADTLLSNSVICAIGVLQHDKQSAGVRNVFSSAHIPGYVVYKIYARIH